MLQRRDSSLALTAAVTLSVVAAAPFLVLPLFAQGVIEDLHYSAREVGIFAALINFGTMLSAIAAGVWVRRLAWRPMALGSLLAILAACALSLRFHAQLPFLAAQCLTGLAGGVLYSLSLTVLSDHPQPDRAFGLCVAAQVAFQIAGLLLGPSLVRWGGINGILVALLLVAALSLPVVRWLPAGGHHERHRAAAPLLTPPLRLALGACLMFYFQVGAYWTYIEQIGRDAGHSAQAVANALAEGVGVGLLGALLAAWWGERYGRIRPLAAATVLVVVSALFVRDTPGLWAFTASAVLYNFAWNFSLPYQYAIVNALDATGRGVALSPAFAAGGLAAGPGVSALLVASGDYGAVIWLTSAGALASLALFAVARRRGPDRGMMEGPRA